MSADAFGPNLRRLRLQKQISLEEIARKTNVPIELLASLEVNDFSAWPIGLFARAYVRQYAAAIGADPDETVNDFCRWFPEGDRRAEALVREHAAILGHRLSWRDDAPPDGQDRRAGAQPDDPAPQPPASPVSALFFRVRRALHKA
jgi:transcriptional regulator with XRE-family HTH domain